MTSPIATRLTLAHIMSAHDTNLLGTVHGGHVMKLVDDAAGTVAARFSGGPAVTAAMDEMLFVSPVRVGDVITVNAQVQLGRPNLPGSRRPRGDHPLGPARRTRPRRHRLPCHGRRRPGRRHQGRTQAQPDNGR